MRKTDWYTNRPKEYSEGFSKGEKWYDDGCEIPINYAKCKYFKDSDEWFAFQDGFIDGYISAENNDIKTKTK